MDGPIKSRRKVVERISCLTKGVFSPFEGVYSPEIGKLGSNRTVTFSKGSWHHKKTIGKETVHRKELCKKCEPQERNPCAPRLEERTQDETLDQERCAPRVPWDLAKNVYKLKIRIKRRFTLPSKPGRRRRPLQTIQRKDDSWLAPEHQCTC